MPPFLLEKTVKLTLLDIVQDIANDLDSDEVNSIDDTMESVQIAQIVKSSYLAMMSKRNWPHLRRGVQLEASTVVERPTHMVLADEVKELSLVNYDKQREGDTNKNYQPVEFIEVDDFLRVSNQRRSSNENVITVLDDSGIELLILNDTAPKYYTTFNDTTLVFDSYDVSVDSTLQSNKVQAQGYINPIWTMEDDFIPDLPSEAFQALQEEAKSRASIKLRQITDTSASAEAIKQDRWLAQKAWRVDGGTKFPNYGRRGARYRDPTFKQGR